MATHCSILAWKTPGYSLWGHKRVGHDLATKQQQQQHKHYKLAKWQKKKNLGQYFQYKVEEELIYIKNY